MRNESYPARRGRPIVVLAVACLALYGVALSPSPAEAGSFVIPAWAFDRGNGRTHVDPDVYADAEPVVGSGDRQPWGWSLEYDIDIPVTGVYRLHIQYASAESRPIEVYYDTRNVSKTCFGISLSPGASGEPTWKSSGARWEMLRNRFGGPASLSKNSRIAPKVANSPEDARWNR